MDEPRHRASIRRLPAYPSVLHDILGGRGPTGHKLDGRTEKRRKRLLRELEAGKARGSRELKPLDILQRVQELMDLGEPLSSIRKVTKVRKSGVPPERSRIKSQLETAPSRGLSNFSASREEGEGRA